MRPGAPSWLSRAIGRPGSVSFRRFAPVVGRAAFLADEMRAGSDAEVKAVVATSVRAAHAEPPPARLLAALREAARRTIGVEAFDEQLLACCALVTGHGVEMDTGEGKTLVGALAAAVHAAEGRHVHVVSVNDYLARRDAEGMGPLFALLGMSVAWVGQETPQDVRRRVYRSDVVYAPVGEIGFDVLRDRFVVDPAERVRPVLDVAIVDEADAVMIDEAMVPLVLAGSDAARGPETDEATRLVERLQEGRDFAVDADHATASLTDRGIDAIEGMLGGQNLFAEDSIHILTRVNLALHARVFLRRDVDYLVEGDAVRLVSTSRGRVARLQRWPDGLQAAVEAKERLAISTPGIILDSITIQDLLRSYATLTGMSGTMLAVAEDLLEFYELPAGRVERREPNRRADEPDRVFLTGIEKTTAVVDEVVARHGGGQPVLVGTQSVAESESLADALRRTGIEPRVLNAKNDADEASIVARAGEHGAVTISTQMSGRGTDVRLGGADEGDRERVVATGGLAVVSAGRYPSGRLDAQLRGRAGRQGDPGSSVLMAALADELVQAHAPAHLLAEVARRGAGMAQARRRAIVDASQRIAAGVRRDRHRATWVYSRAISAQRAAVLARRHALEAEDAAVGALRSELPDHLALLEAGRGRDATAGAVRSVLLFHLDDHWTDHLALLQEVRDGIHLRALAGQRPSDEFHRIALREFAGFFEKVFRDAADFVACLSPDDVGRDLEELGLRRPSATWTYMITDDPLGSAGDRLTGRAGRAFRSKVLGIE
ncbi:accessory Sec system translocase SecA2 [Microbacterium betulae]|uniref:Protein translocase subunit SecA n=1 Tax=Microbacterium betulae TaxID=2981139 RepID=A0AA97I4A0_9MICO|nr:accessory Sec system translocase SecA2 [Microbacterium sp. AB]WOF21539.1 accessory Sec system translocase SecA2 [Microbacterium sp. AB]